MLYEMYHAAMHMSYEKWMEVIKKFPFLRRAYCFHLMHHVNKRVNEAISGFLLIAVVDRLAGTYCPTVGLPDKNGRFAIPPKLPTPRRLVALLDEKWKPIHLENKKHL